MLNKVWGVLDVRLPHQIHKAPYARNNPKNKQNAKAPTPHQALSGIRKSLFSPDM